MGIEHQIITLLGVAVVSFVGERILIGAGQQQMANDFKLIVTIGGTLWVAKLVYDGMTKVIQVFGGGLW